MAGLRESYPTGLAGKGTSTGLCHSQHLGKLDQQWIILWCLMVSYIPPQSSCFTFLTYDIFFLFPSSLAMLGICRSFTSLFFSFDLFCFLVVLSIFTRSYMLCSLLSTCTFGTSSTTVWALYLSLCNQGEERHKVELRKRNEERLTSLQPPVLPLSKASPPTWA